MKTAISIPDDIFEEAEAYAREAGMTRSELYRRALEAYLARRRRQSIRRRLNEFYSEHGAPPVDPALQAAAVAMLSRVEWEE